MELIPLTVPEVRRLLIALAEPDERFSVRLAWSTFRRRHQAVARRCHAIRRSLRNAYRATNPTNQLSSTLPTSSSFSHIGISSIQVLQPEKWNLEFSDERWERVSPLLPPQKPRTGRPANDHRTILEGIFWIMRTGASWRDLPASFGPWQTLYTRYQRWCKAGIWQQILDTIDQEEVS